ncbi:hypothetical protein IAI09_24415 (plasmid) [Lysinibacillus fusiformis]|uniref:Uncharacterized protein n=1 Tax=Lysinibacillus fusiformis TaxID=28031 RepID=A0A1E4QYJ8_9BACI|nr:hypothetical protein [Lysinibacillus fusiformis]ODV53281.1 hypothetical protein BG258_23555 [Lysinibacillus fusiformis]
MSTEFTGFKRVAERNETFYDFSMSLNFVEKNQGKLLMVHASKGLESLVVIIIGAKEGTTPHHRATTSK